MAQPWKEPAQPSATQRNPAQPSATQRNPAQPSATQCCIQPSSLHAGRSMASSSTSYLGRYFINHHPPGTTTTTTTTTTTPIPVAHSSHHPLLLFGLTRVLLRLSTQHNHPSVQADLACLAHSPEHYTTQGPGDLLLLGPVQHGARALDCYLRCQLVFEITSGSNSFCRC